MYSYLPARGAVIARHNVPIFEAFAAAAPVIVTRYLDRDEHADVQAALKINGGNRVPVRGVLLGRWPRGRPLRRADARAVPALTGQNTGEVCGSGIVNGDDPVQVQVIQDWLNEFERVQWILRLSPRLRKLHGD